MKIKENYLAEVVLEEEEICIFDKTVKVIDNILDIMYNKNCNYFDINHGRGSYSTETLEETREHLCNIVGIDAIYRG